MKQTAKTLNFLTENHIEQYTDLVSWIDEVAVASEQIAGALKGVEKRLADMALFIKKISTYQKTKPVYDAYRAAKNKVQYHAGQESNIILHEAANKAIKAAGIPGKLQSVYTLQAEYGKLQEQKETLYADYGKLKKQVKGYGVIKQNIDSILRLNKESNRGKETGQSNWHMIQYFP